MSNPMTDVAEIAPIDVEALFAEIDARQQRLAVAMPTDHDALRVMAEAMARLTALGWRDACYCPKDGSTFDVIEAGSVGIHKAHYQGDWPKGTWWIHDSGDLWPSRPILFRAHLTQEQPR